VLIARQAAAILLLLAKQRAAIAADAIAAVQQPMPPARPRPLPAAAKRRPLPAAAAAPPCRCEGASPPLPPPGRRRRCSECLVSVWLPHCRTVAAQLQGGPASRRPSFTATQQSYCAAALHGCAGPHGCTAARTCSIASGRLRGILPDASCFFSFEAFSSSSAQRWRSRRMRSRRRRARRAPTAPPTPPDGGGDPALDKVAPPQGS
jgi:hypothetical protein